MKRIFYIFVCVLFGQNIANAQVTSAQDFTMSDCASSTHNLYSYLDNEEVVIMEFFMNCGSCIAAGQKLSPMYDGLLVEHPGLVNFWALAYTNSYTCTTVNNWVTTNSINAVPFDSGATQVAYYGGFAMPTVVVVAGSQHQVIYNSNFDGPQGDTAAIHAAIDNFFNTMGIDKANNTVQFKAYPNPAINTMTLEMNFITGGQAEIDMVDMMGKVVKKVANENYAAGVHTLQLETSDITNGIYFVRVALNGKSIQYKVSVKH